MAGDKISEAVRILAALVGVAQDPTLLSALKAGPGLRDSLKKIAASPPTSFARLADDLGQSGTTVFASMREKPRDAEVLYLQMVEAGLPDPARIMADRMDAAAVTEGMLAGLTEREHRDPAMQALFRALTQPTLERLLADKAFAADLTPAFMRAVLENFAGLAEKLDSMSRQGRDVLEVLAVRFEIARIYDLSDAQLREQLELRATDFRRFKAQIEAIDERTRGLGNLKAAARDAAGRLDFAEVEALLARVDKVETEIAVETKVLRADNALLRGAAREAFAILSAAADSFASIDPMEPARRRLSYGQRLNAYGLRYGGEGLAFSVRMFRAALNDPSMEIGSELWAGTQNNLGNALQSQGARLGGQESAALLGEAVIAYRSALRVWTEAAHPVHWAMAQNNLGIALWTQGERFGGPEGAALLGEAVMAYRAALRVWTEAEHPVNWASVQNNLGAALHPQGAQLGGAKGNALLGEAVTANRAALRVWTEAAHPVSWATSQNNLGNALRAQGQQFGGPEGTALIGEAVMALRDALRVRTKAAHPVDWAMTTGNLGLANESLADNSTCADPRTALESAVECFTGALRIYDPEAMLYDHESISESLARVRAKLAALPDPA